MQSCSAKLNILFTSAGRRVELLRSFRRAYDVLKVDGKIIALDIDPLAPALQVADKSHTVPRSDSAEYLPRLLDICREEEIDLIFPILDLDVQCLSRNRIEIESTGAKAVVVSPEIATLTFDKWLTTNFFQELGLFTPRSWRPEDIDITQLSYPLFIKPRQGGASKFAYKIEDEKELEFYLDRVPNPIIQEFLSGPEITNDVTCDLDGSLLSIVSRQRIQVRGGEVCKGVTIYEPSIIEACTKITKTMPFCGPINIQCMLQDKIPYFTEINARFGGGVPLSIAAGADSPHLLLASAIGAEEEIPPIGQYQTGLYLTRFDESFFISEAGFER